MADYVSNIKSIAASRHRVYATLSDLTGLSRIGEALKQHPEASKIQIEAIDQDTCAFVISGAGRLTLKVVEREPDKTIKLEAEQSPVPITLWVQLLEAAPEDTRLRLTLRTELNFLMKKMIGGKLQDGVERMADMMAAVPYR
ncbi:SRPBCC family protein [Porphyromonas sp. COT-290 OH860]|uniref:SRPBCC family protein n=1 Tax=Porphyromonas sp. COT-290 OH860 TaxID=1515615 RepID=UPI00052C3C69|nr:SRPBCC family protein [Porphyromonas sp. COT-290 OH860]KGN83979.1 polyketide cyclase [Porphyromonas sp. COT-290 OH860]